jgi:ketosteroid isomerase-like protein
MSQENVAIVRGAFETFLATGEPAWDALDDHVEVYDHDILDAGEYRGHAGVARWLSDWEKAWGEFTMTPEEFIDAGEQVIVVLRMKATGRGSGATLERQDAMVWQVRDEGLVRLDYFNSKQQALESVGLAE